MSIKEKNNMEKRQTTVTIQLSDGTLVTVPFKGFRETITKMEKALERRAKDCKNRNRK